MNDNPRSTNRSSRQRAIAERLQGEGFETLFEETVRAARAAGDRVLLTQDPRNVTGAQLAGTLDRLPRALVGNGMRPGQVVLFGVRPGIDALMLLLAAVRAGAIVTFVDSSVTSDQLARRLELLAPDWVVADSLLYVASAPTPLRGYLRRRGFSVPRLARLAPNHVRVGRKLPFVPQSLEYGRLVADASHDDVEPPHGLDVDAPALVTFHGGAAGASRGVQHTGRSISATIRMYLERLEVAEDSVFYGQGFRSMVMAILLGAPAVVEPMEFRAQRFLDDVERHGVTHAFRLPVEARALVEHCESRDRGLPASLRQLVLDPAPVGVPVLERLLALAHDDLEVSCVYAMPELAPATWMDARDAVSWSGDGEPVGRICAGVEWRIDGRGELHLKGDNCHHGYVGVDDDRIEWHATGNVARVDGVGHVVLEAGTAGTAELDDPGS